MVPIRVRWEYEDRLPDDLTDDEFDRMFPLSRVIDGVRMYPYVVLNEDNDFLMEFD